MTTAGLFTITNMWARLTWATHRQRDKAQHTPTMEYYSATERNDALRASCNMDELWKCDAWLRKPDANGHVVQLCLYEVSGIGNSRETEGNGWLPSAGAGGMTRHCLMGTDCYVGLIEMLWNSIQRWRVAQHCSCTRCHWIIHFNVTRLRFQLTYTHYYT